MGGWGTAAFPPLHWVANACSTQSFQGPESRRPLPLTEVFLAVSWPQKTSGLSGKHSCGPSGVCARPFRSLGKTQFFTMRPAVKSSSWNVWPFRLRVFEHPFPSPSGGGSHLKTVFLLLFAGLEFKVGWGYIGLWLCRAIEMWLQSQPRWSVWSLLARGRCDPQGRGGS